MKNTKLLYATLLAIVIAFYSMLSFGEENKREWLTSACYRFTLTVRDKFSDAVYVAKYTVTAKGGSVYVVEKNATDEDSSRAVFPDDFRESNTNRKVWANCNDGERYKWAIYTDNVLIDSGTIGFSRDKRK